MPSLKEKLRTELECWSKKTYSELVTIEYPYTYERGVFRDPDWYEVEVVLLERTDEYVHISIGVSDGGLSAFFPKSANLLVYANAKPQG